MSKKCKAYSESKIGLEPADNRKAFYAGWDAALHHQPAQKQETAFTFGGVERTMQALRKGTLEQQQAYEVMKDKPLYTSLQPTQPCKPWTGLTPEQRASIAEANNMLVDDDLFDDIETKLREMNA